MSDGFISKREQREIEALWRSATRTPRTRWWQRKYRIVADHWAGFEVQCWRWWFPFWVMPYCNTYISVERAEAAARGHAAGVVKNLGPL